MSDAARRLAALTPEQRERLLQRMQNAAPTSKEDRIPRRADAAIAPLSFAQQRMWFLEQLLPNSPAYHIPVAVRLRGPLDEATLERVIDWLVTRHEALRTSFPLRDGSPVQNIADRIEWELERFSVADDAEALGVLTNFVKKPFDLPTGPLMRAALVRLGENEHVLSVVLHHIITDGWSMGILVRELVTAYDALATGVAPPFEVPAIQYGDFATWQRQRISDSKLDAHVAYFEKRLADIEPLELPFDRPRPALQSDRGATLEVVLEQDVSRRLFAFAESANASGFMLALSLYAALLGRLSGQERFGIGFPIAARSLLQLEPVVGLFANTLVCRVDLSGRPTLKTLLARTKAELLAAFSHQDAPFERIVRALEPERDTSRSPVFQTMLALGSSSGSMPRSSLAVSEFTLDAKIAKFDLTLELDWAEHGIHGKLEYNTDLFDPTTAESIRDRFVRLARALLDEPDRPIEEIPWLTPEEEGKLHDWSAAATSARPAELLHSGLERQAETSPDAIALVDGEQKLTYAELRERAREFANVLCGSGLDHGLVALVSTGSADAAVALVGISMAGAGYVPIDPELPEERLLFITRDAEVRAVVAPRDFAPRVSASGVPLIDLSRSTASNSRIPEISPESLAYVIYTSGTTGTPKGVAVTHRSASLFATAAAEAFALCPGDRVLQFHSLAFDVSVEEMFPAWSAGATVVLDSARDSRSPEGLLELVTQQGISVLDLPTSYFHAWVDSLEAMEKKLPSALRLVVVGGEALAPERVRRFHALADSRIELVNAYGPTETTVDVTLHRASATRDSRPPPIGRPFGAAKAFVLDAGGRQVAPGVAGELHIGGDCLARGYLNRPELTAERFVPSPFGAGERLYRTGDRARFRADGELEFLGRVDHQIKLRGFRIELGEIEAALQRQDGVLHAVADVVSIGERRLVAWLVARPGVTLSATALRNGLSRSLPGYMIPTWFEMVSELPLTSGGKIDRRRLPRITTTKHGITLPRNDLEEKLAAIFARVLGVAEIDVDDSFFKLGGDSISGVQVAARARREGLAVDVRQIFQAPSVAELARIVKPLARSSAATPTRRTSAPLTPIQRWFFEREPANPAHFNQALWLELDARVKSDVIRAALEEIVRQHPALSLTFAKNADGTLEQRVTAIRADWFSEQELMHESELERVAAELQTRLDIFQGPVFRARFVRLGERRLLFLVAHHLVMDAVSLRILGDDLGQILADVADSKPPELAPESTSYLEWAVRLSAFDVRDEKSYWEARAEIPVPALPKDHPVTRDPVLGMRSVSIRLDERETEALFASARRAYRVEAVELLLAALAVAVSRWADTRVVCVEMEAHGREAIADDIDISRTVGWFTTTYPLVFRLPDPGLEAALLGVKEEWRNVPRRGLGFGLLRNELGEVKSEILFNYLGRVKTAGAGDSAIRLASVPTGPSIDSRFERSHPLDVSAVVMDDSLRIALRYGRAHDEASMERLADELGKVLAELEATASAAAGRFTPSDFALVRAEPAELEALAASLAKRGSLDGIEDIYPLSPLQHGILIDSLAAKDDGVYVEQTGLFIDGALDPRALLAAFELVIARHSILRTSFEWEGLGRPLQVVWTNLELAYAFHSLDELDKEARETEAERLAEADRRQRFQLDERALRVTCLRLSATEHRLLVTYHHILLDGWSTAALFAELASAYEAARSQERLALPKPLPYRAYIGWILGQDEARAKEHWQRTLSGFSEPTPLGIDRGGRTAAASARRSTSLGIESTRALRELARSRNLTDSTLGHAAWALTLSRYSGRDDVVFGSTVSSRPAELSGVVSALGLYINTVPIRVRMDRRQPTSDFLTDVQRTLLDAQAHAHAPLSIALAATEVPRDTPLFSTSVVVENYPAGGALGQRADSPRIRKVESRESISIPLVLLVVPSTSLELVCQYDPARFSAEDVDALLGVLRGVLEKMAGDPGVTLARLLTVDGTARAELLELASGEARAGALDFVPAAIEACAERHPERIALTSESGELSYGELEGRSNRLANHLRSLGVGSEVFVGVALERSLEQVIATLAVMKAGGAYLPLDLGYPKARLAFMLNDARVPILLTDVAHAEELDAVGRMLVCIDRDDIASLSAARPERATHPDSAMYAIYTSGSTGLPKAAINTHAALANRLHWMQDAYRLGQDDVVLHKTPFGFDVSGWELWWPLMFGARLVLARPGGEKDPEYLAALIQAERVTTLHFVPPMLSAFLEQPAASRCLSLRRVICSGEALTPPAVSRFAERMPESTVLENLYGPTEAAIDVTRFACPKTALERVPIGAPIWNTRTYVLGHDLEPCPRGAIGELYLAGIQLARAYLERPELTAERFLPDPFVAGDRMYRTGDLARVDARGELEYLGRVDAQIKLRGYRIELGEIEAGLAAHARVSAAAVVLRDDPPRIVGYLSPLEAREGEGEILAALGETLPSYMLPSELVYLEALPLGPTGKVDRKALPAPTRRASAVQALPRNQKEAMLARLVAEALRLPEVDVHADFFRMGGDSILALQVTSRARAAGLAFTVRELFLNPTVSALANLARHEEAKEPEPEPESAPLTPIQRWFFQRNVPNRSHFNQALWLELQPELTPAFVERALAEIVKQHPALGLRFEAGMQRYAKSEPCITHHALPQITDDAVDAQLLAIAETEQRSLDIERGPVFRAAVVTLGERPARLFLVAHHLVVDTVSLRVIAEDLDIAGRALVAGEPIVLPPRTTGFLTFASRVEALSQEDTTRAEIPTWRRILEATPAGIPTVGAGENRISSAAAERFELDADETQRLVREASDVLRVDVAESLLAALFLALVKTNPQKQLRLDIEGHGRDAILSDLDLTRTVGWFTTLFPVTFDLGSASVDGALKAVKTALREVPQKGAGFGLAQRGCTELGEYAPSRILFNYLGHVSTGTNQGELLRLSRTPSGLAVDPSSTRAYELDVVGVIANERLSVSITYGQALHDKARIQELLKDMVGSLRAILEAARVPTGVGVVPADFPLARVSQKALDKFLSGRGRRK